MMCIFVLALLASAASERILVVTPQTHLSDGSGTSTEGDSYVEAHREMHDTVRDRRNPLGSYEEDYDALGHSSFVEDDAYLEPNRETTHHHKPHRHHHHQQQHRHPPPDVMYGPPTPVSYYHHHHHHHRHRHPEHVSSHHTLIDIFPPFHFFTAFLHKFGIHKIVKIIAKIAVLKVILKFITVIALFLVLPAFAPQDKEKDESDDDGLLKSLDDVTDRIWNGIAAREKMDVPEHHGNNQTRHPAQPTHPEIPQKPPQHVTDRPDKDKDKDKCKDKEKDKCKDKDKNMEGDKCKEKEKEKEESEKDEGGLDDADVKLLRKIIKQWKEENFGGPDKSSAVSFLRNCVATANRILGILLGYLKMKQGNMDVLDAIVFNRFSANMKRLAKMWPHLLPAWKGSSSPFS